MGTKTVITGRRPRRRQIEDKYKKLLQNFQSGLQLSAWPISQPNHRDRKSSSSEDEIVLSGYIRKLIETQLEDIDTSKIRYNLNIAVVKNSNKASDT